MAKQVFSHGTYQVYGEGNHGYCGKHDKVVRDGETCPGCDTEKAELEASEPSAADLDAVSAEKAVEAQTEG